MILYDISMQESIPVDPLLNASGFFVLIVCFSVALRVFKKKSFLCRKISFFIGGISAGCILIIFLLNIMRGKTNNFIEISKDGRMKVVEGQVENFHPMPMDGHDTENFYVGGIYFSYSDFVIPLFGTKV